MRSSPYRTITEVPLAKDESAEPVPDGQLLPVFALLWASSVVRVVLGATDGETFGRELTLATIALLLLPLLMKDALRAVWTRLRSS